MIRKRGFSLGQLALIAVLSAFLPESGIAHGGGGGRGGDSGDSSMNPFTGDSYAYFHGGHNLGEQGMNIPWRKQVPTSADSSDRNVPNATANSPATTMNGATRKFQSLDTSREDQRTDTQQAGKR
jgi:hypothetical protein